MRKFISIIFSIILTLTIFLSMSVTIFADEINYKKLSSQNSTEEEILKQEYKNIKKMNMDDLNQLIDSAKKEYDLNNNQLNTCNSIKSKKIIVLKLAWLAAAQIAKKKDINVQGN